MVDRNPLEMMNIVVEIFPLVSFALKRGSIYKSEEHTIKLLSFHICWISLENKCSMSSLLYLWLLMYGVTLLFKGRFYIYIRPVLSQSSTSDCFRAKRIFSLVFELQAKVR